MLTTITQLMCTPSGAGSSIELSVSANISFTVINGQSLLKSALDPRPEAVALIKVIIRKETT